MTYFERLQKTAGVGVAVVLLVLTGLRVVRAWPAEAYLGYAEGIWSALAIDVAHGTFYRPLSGPLGFGGTRYFPLFFTVHGALIRAGLSPIAAGHLVAASAVVLLVFAVAWLIRSSGGTRSMAAAAAAIAVACQPTQMALLTIRGDGLAAALALVGLASIAGRRARWIAVGTFALAFAAKPTSLYAPLSAIVWLLIQQRRREAWMLAAGTAAGLFVVLAAMEAASAGRALAIIGASAAGGGSWQSLLSAPMNLAHILRRVPESAVLMVGAFAVCWRSRHLVTLEQVACIACGVATLGIFASPATVENHLIDLTAIAVVVVAAWTMRDPGRVRFLTMGTIMAAAITGATAASRWITRDDLDLHASRQDALAAVADAHLPVFVEQPMLAAKAGWQAYLVDPYLFSLRVTRDPDALLPLLDDLRQQRFGAVMLEHADLELAVQDTFPAPAGARFLAALDEAYVLERVVDGRPIFRPRR